MFVQIAIGSLLMLTTISLTGATLLVVEVLIRRFQPWLTREPHGPKLAIVLIAAALWVMGVVTVDVWTWALAFDLLGILPTLESSVYFALVSFTTLGYGDLVLPHQGNGASGGQFQNVPLKIAAAQIGAHLGIKTLMAGVGQQPCGHAVRIFPDCQQVNGIIMPVAIVNMMRDVSRVEIATMIGGGDCRGVEGLKAFQIGCSGVGSFEHLLPHVILPLPCPL